MSAELTHAWIDTLMNHDGGVLAAVVFREEGCSIGARNDVMDKPTMVVALRRAADELEQSMLRGDLDPEPGGWNRMNPGGDGS